MKPSKEFNEWDALSKDPQGHYEVWQWLEFRDYAWRAWQAGRKSVTTRADTKGN